MVVLLFICSVICVVGGAAAVGFGIPVKEFSFGNTLILGGVVAFVGGLIQFGLGLAVIHLQRIMDALSARPPMRVGRAMEPFDQLAPAAATRSGQSRVPFPPRSPSPAPEAPPVSPQEPEAVVPEVQVAPALRNPDEPPMVAEDADTSLSPQQTPAPVVGAPPENADQTRLTQAAPATEASEDWRVSPPAARSPQTTFFDDMWPAETPRAPRPAEELQQDQRVDVATEPKPFQAEPPMRAPAGDVHAIAILKSGVVDGMGYTLYVDGSIEAELPQGKLRFASINELRAHLEKGS